MKNKIAIITSTYNCVEYVADCINSVKNQKDISVEHIIVDGGSTDGTLDIIIDSEQKENSRITWWCSEKDNGIYHAWNKALNHINSEWVLFLGADDTLYSENSLHEISSVLNLTPENISIIYGTLNIIEKDGSSHIWNRKWQNFRSEFRNGKSLRHTAVLHRSTLFKKLGDFDESYKIAGDSEFLLRELLKNDAVSCDICVANHLAGGVSNNINSYVRQLKEGLKIRKTYKLPAGYIKRQVIYTRYYIKILLLLIFPNNIAAFFIDLGRIVQGKGRNWSL